MTVGSIVNIGRGSTGINIGNSATLFNVIGKVRLSSTPLLVYAFSSSPSTSQNIPSGPTIAESVIKWQTGGIVTNNTSSTGITYDSGTGIFTNSNSYPIIVTVCLNVGYAQGNAVGVRVAWIQHTVGTNSRLSCVNMSVGGDYTTLSTTATFVLLTGEGFFANTYQNSGVALTIGGTIQGASPTRISILVM